MDFLYGKAPKSMTLIRTLFGIILLFFLFAIVAMITLDLQRTVRASGGEIIAENGPIVYLAPVAAEVQTVLVRSGDPVRRGDTLLVLHAPELTAAMIRTAEERRQARHNIGVYHDLIDNLSAQIAYQKDRRATVEGSIGMDRATGDAELQALMEQTRQARRKLDLTAARLRKEYQLFADGIISEAEYSQKNRAYLAELTQVTDLEKRFEQQRARSKFAPTQGRDRRSEHQLTLLASENERLNLERQLEQERINLTKLEHQYERDSLAVARLYPVARTDGRVSKLFNLRAGLNRVTAGQELLTLLPEGETSYLARLKMPQAGMRDVEIGQVTRLKVDAFHHFRYGILRGTVTHIDHHPVDGFYLLADIPDDQATDIVLQTGYAVKGEVVTGEVPLWRFMGEVLFE